VLTFVVTFSYWCINYIALELAMPFGDDSNDLPLHNMQRSMNQSLRTLINPKSQAVPNFGFHVERHSELIIRIADFQASLVDAEELEKVNTSRVEELPPAVIVVDQNRNMTAPAPKTTIAPTPQQSAQVTGSPEGLIQLSSAGVLSLSPDNALPRIAERPDSKSGGAPVPEYKGMGNSRAPDISRISRGSNARDTDDKMPIHFPAPTAGKPGAMSGSPRSTSPKRGAPLPASSPIKRDL